MTGCPAVWSSSAKKPRFSFAVTCKLITSGGNSSNGARSDWPVFSSHSIASNSSFRCALFRTGDASFASLVPEPHIHPSHPRDDDAGFGGACSASASCAASRRSLRSCRRAIERKNRMSRRSSLFSNSRRRPLVGISCPSAVCCSASSFSLKSKTYSRRRSRRSRIYSHVHTRRR